MLPRCSCISRCGRRPCKPYRPSVYFGLYFRLSYMIAFHSWKQMQQTCLYLLLSPNPARFLSRQKRFALTITKASPHDKKGLCSRWNNSLSSFAGLRSRFLAYEIALQNVKISRSLTHHICSATPALSLVSSEASYEWNFSLCDVYNALYLRM